MKPKKLFYTLVFFALSLIPFGIWSIVELFTDDYNYWSIGIFLVLFFITGYLAKEHAAGYSKDPKAFIDSFNSK